MTSMIRTWILAVTSLTMFGRMVNAEDCVTLTTFNAGLTPHVPKYSSRKSLIPEALVEENSDVLCLQEYWLEQDMQEMLDEVQSVYPHHYSAIHYQVGQVRKPSEWYEIDYPDSACSVKDVTFITTALIPCAVAEGCTSAFTDGSPEGLECLATKCRRAMGCIDSNCLQCIVMMATSASNVLSSCANPSPLREHNRLNAPGLVLLSKKKINSVSYKSYFPGRKMILQRGHLEADIEDVGKVVCTHLTSTFKFYFEYDLPLVDNFQMQQFQEIQTIQSRFGGTDHILLGDLNACPAVDDPDPEKKIQAMEPENYKTLMAAGYQNTYIDNDGRCTFCSNNPVNKDRKNNILDHVLLMGTAAKSQRTLDFTGDKTLSDHYGVRAKLCKRSK